MGGSNVAGLTVVLTGSTGGLGGALAAALRRRGARLALFDLDAVAVEAQALDLGAIDEVRGWAVDVRDLDGLTAAMDSAAEHFGSLDVVVANAGTEALGPFDTVDPTSFERVVDVNLTGVWRTFRAASPHVRQTRGHLLAISSMAAFVHSPLQSSYTASKAGVWALCDSIRLELRHTGVTVGSVHPTFFDTPMMKRARENGAITAVWANHEKSPWKFVERTRVVDDIVGAIERRATLTTVPRRLTFFARTAGLIRPVIDRWAFPARRVSGPIESAARAGANRVEEQR